MRSLSSLVVSQKRSILNGLEELLFGTIRELYKTRWQIEIFFREIKQLLHIKSFVGTSENAVMIQIWTALITILVLKVLKAIAKYPWYLSNLVAFIRLNLFVKINLQKWLDEPFIEPEPPPIKSYQGVLFRKKKEIGWKQ